MFRVERYIQELRAATAAADLSIPEDVIDALEEPRVWLLGGSAPNLLRVIAHLWCGAMLDTRCDTLLLPVLVRATDLRTPLDAFLECCNHERNWNLPAGFFEERLSNGACLILLEEEEGFPGQAACVVSRFPHCRYIVASGTDQGDAGAGEGRFDFGGAESRRIIVDLKGL